MGPIGLMPNGVEVVQGELRFVPQLFGKGGFARAGATEHKDLFHRFFSPFTVS